VNTENIEMVVCKTTAKMLLVHTYWSRATMAAVMGRSEATIGRICRAHGLKPHRVQTFKVSRDPNPAAKLEDTAGL
jgi:hypothetical protein